MTLSDKLNHTWCHNDVIFEIETMSTTFDGAGSQGILKYFYSASCHISEMLVSKEGLSSKWLLDNGRNSNKGMS